MSLPSFDRVQSRIDHLRRGGQVVEIQVDENIRKRFHRKGVLQSELDKNRRAGKKQLIDESIYLFLY